MDIQNDEKFNIILWEQTPKVVDIHQSEIQDWIEQNRDFMKIFLSFSNETGNALGLSANQVAYKGNRIDKRFFVFRSGDSEKYPLQIAINPKTEEVFGEASEMVEGCLSWPKKKLLAKRFLRIRASYYDINGNFVRREMNKVEAQIWQHEIDHLNGVEEIFVSNGVSLKEFQRAGRNDPCPCGKKSLNGVPVKYKKCCGS